jgi:hypothetical protein
MFTWLVSKGSISQGSVAGSIGTPDNYRTITIDGVKYLAHKLAWLYMTGHYPQYPKEEIDHANSNGDDNRWCNLQLTDHRGNCNNPITLRANAASKTGALASLESRDRMSQSRLGYKHTPETITKIKESSKHRLVNK